MTPTLVAILCLAPLAASAQTATPMTAWVAPVHTTEDEHFAKRRQSAAFAAPAEKADPAIVELLIQQQESMLQTQSIQVQILLLLQDMRGVIKVAGHPVLEQDR